VPGAVYYKDIIDALVRRCQVAQHNLGNGTVLKPG
jgi:hypothetical protein